MSAAFMLAELVGLLRAANEEAGGARAPGRSGGGVIAMQVTGRRAASN